MATQERAACWDCGRTFDEFPIAPPPNYCPGCRQEPTVVIDLNQLRKDVVVTSRPKYITCLGCGRSVTVRRRGAIPTHCRGGCPSSRLDENQVSLASTEQPVAEATAKSRRRKRLGPADPWDAPAVDGPVYLDDLAHTYR